MDTYQDKVFDFHYKNGIPYWKQLKKPRGMQKMWFYVIHSILSVLNKLALKVSKSSVKGDKNDQMFRLHLILDEVTEINYAIIKGNETALADGTTDLLYVTFGMQVVYFVPSQEVFDEVHRSNLTKDFKNTDRRKYKGNNFSPPNIQMAISKGRIRQIEEYRNANNRRIRLSGQDDAGE